MRCRAASGGRSIVQYQWAIVSGNGGPMAARRLAWIVALFVLAGCLACAPRPSSISRTGGLPWLRTTADPRLVIPFLFVVVPVGSMCVAGLDTSAHYLILQYVPEPESMHDTVRRIESGTSFIVSPNGSITTQRYFVPRFDARPTRGPADSARLYDEITEVMRDSVAKHMLDLKWAPVTGAAVITRKVWDQMSPAGPAGSGCTGPSSCT